MPKNKKRDERRELLVKAAKAWEEIHALATDVLLPCFKAHVKELEDIDAKTACEAENAAVLQKSIVLAGIHHRAADSMKNLLLGSYSLFNTCHHLDVILESVANEELLEDTIIKLRGVTGDTETSFIFLGREVQMREVVDKGIAIGRAMRKKSLDALQPARVMTLQSLDDYRNWVTNERPDLIEPMDAHNPFDMLLPIAEA